MYVDQRIDMGAVGSACEQSQSMYEYRVAGSFRLDHEQGNFELQMMGFLWFRVGVRAWDRKRCHTHPTERTGRHAHRGPKSCGQDPHRNRT